MLNAQVNIALGLNYQQKFEEALPLFEELLQNDRVKKLKIFLMQCNMVCKVIWAQNNMLKQFQF
jgi:hypothetical protein